MPSVTTSTFRERVPWVGGDLQTLRNQVRPVPGPPVGRDISIPLTDGSGDVMTGVLFEPPVPAGPLVVLIHGLTGSVDSAYIRAGAVAHLAANRRVFCVNLRGAGSSAASVSRYYHSGCASDMVDVLAVVRPLAGPDGMVLVGHSLGGSVLVNTLAALADDSDIRGAMTVSAPVDPAAAASRLAEPRNAVYQHNLLRQMKQTVREVCDLGPDLARTVAAVGSIEAFDDVFTGPVNGYGTGAEYYRQTDAGTVAERVTVPLLMVHADNDPWIPVGAYRRLQLPSNVTIEITRGGGHVGFHGVGSRMPWYARRAVEFFDAL